jgi:glyoxylate/hydroxypyruvate reductase A
VANGFQVSAWSQSHKTIDKVQCCSGQKGLDSLLANCQILVCLLPLTEQTRDMLNRDLFDRLPHNASLINFARGDLLVMEDLLEKLKQDALYHAVLDVYRIEPLNRDSTLWYHPKITVLPHISASTNPQTAVKIVAANLQVYRNDGKPDSIVDLDKGY